MCCYIIFIIDIKRKLILLSLNILNKAFNDLIRDSESESEEKNKIEKMFIVEVKSKTRPRKRKISRCQNYFEEIIPKFSFKEFQMHFRMSPQAYEALCQRIIPIIKENYHTGHPHKNLEKQILAVIWLLGTSNSYR